MPSLLHRQAEAGGHGWPGRAVPAPLRRAQVQEALSLPAERRRQLQELGLRALVKRRFGDAVAARAEAVKFSGGVALAGEGTAAVFADSPIGLGAAIDAAHRAGAQGLLFFCEGNDGDVARRAKEFALDVDVIDPDGDLRVLDPGPPPPHPPMPEWDVFGGTGLDVVWEHGVLSGEWLGLEVARTDDGVHVDVGVGKHDRELNRMLYPDGPDVSVLVAARETVAALRREGAPPHPANQLSPERWLRTVLVRSPSLVGLAAQSLLPAPPPEPRDDLRQRAVAPAVGEGVVVVASVGVDPDVVAQAADARLQLEPRASLMIAVPEGDDHPLTRRLAALLRQPAEVVTVRPDWRSLLG